MSYDVQMHYDLSFETPDNAFATLVEEFRDQTINGGDAEHIGMSPSRVGDVAMMNHPALIVLGGCDPVQRVLFNPARDANPFFHLYEAMWMLSGSEDIRSLEIFSSKIASFCSDDGKTANGAYGARWRFARDPEIPSGPGKHIDQLELLIQHLTKNPKSRRAVLQMWMPDKDLLKIDITKDVCCNTAVYFTLREGKYRDGKYLDMTVTNRSNDLVLGLMGANLVHFTILQEYMARSLGVQVGFWYQFTNNLHVYLTANGGFHPDKWIEGAKNLSPAAVATYPAAYDIGPHGIPLKPLFKLPEERFEFTRGCESLVQVLTSTAVQYADQPKDYAFFEHCIVRMDDIVGCRGVTSHYLLNVVFPLLHSYFLYKMNLNYTPILEPVQHYAVDWYVAADEWIKRRLAKKGKVQADE